MTATTSDPRQATFQENICTRNSVLRHVEVHVPPPEVAVPLPTPARHEGALWGASSSGSGSEYNQAVIVETVKSATGERVEIVNKNVS